MIQFYQGKGISLPIFLGIIGFEEGYLSVLLGLVINGQEMTESGNSGCLPIWRGAGNVKICTKVSGEL